MNTPSPPAKKHKHLARSSSRFRKSNVITQTIFICPSCMHGSILQWCYGDSCDPGDPRLAVDR